MTSSQLLIDDVDAVELSLLLELLELILSSFHLLLVLYLGQLFFEKRWPGLFDLFNLPHWNCLLLLFSERGTYLIELLQSLSCSLTRFLQRFGLR